MAHLNRNSAGARLWRTAKKVIPGGNQLLSKRAEMFLPDFWPAYYKKAKGVQIWGLDGRRYIDMSIMGIGTCVLGYANAGVNRAVKKAVDAGNMATLNCPEEVELAEKLVALHPWAGMARFARTGGEACAIAVRIARAASGKDKVLFCGYHGWSDWYLASNIVDSKNLDKQLLPGLRPKGVPLALKGTAIPFKYGDCDGFRRSVEKNKANVGVIIMEVQRTQEIDLAFLKEVRETASRIGAVLVFDEVTSGFRMRAGGMHMLHGIEPDIVVLGKAMGNGYPISAVIGRKGVMQEAQETFISSTYWTERVGFAAALEVIRQFEKEKVADHLLSVGSAVTKRLRETFRSSRLSAEIRGIPPVPTISIREEKALLIKTLMTQEMLKKDFLASTAIYLSLSHTKSIIGAYFSELEQVLDRIAKAKKTGTLEGLLKGPVCHSGFQRIA